MCECPLSSPPRGNIRCRREPRLLELFPLEILNGLPVLQSKKPFVGEETTRAATATRRSDISPVTVFREALCRLGLPHADTPHLQ